MMGVGCSTGNKPGTVIHDIRNGLNYKILLLGDSGVGKTSVFRRFAENTFDPVHRPTKKPLVKNVFQKVNIPADYVVSISLWDVPIKEDIDMRESYYRNVDAVIVVVDMNDPTSIKLAGTWIQDFVNNATKTFTVTEVLPNGHRTTTVKKTIFNPYEVPFLLLGTKFDQIEDQMKERRLKQMIQNPVLDSLDTSVAAVSNTDLVIPDSTITHSDDTSNTKGEIIKKYYTNDGKDDRESNKPECISLLEETEIKYDFLGSMLVSAKLSDGSVDLAFQSLLRHLLDKHVPEKKKEPQEKLDMHQSTKKMRKQDREKYLTYCGIEQLDEMFEKCYIPVKRADDLDSYYSLIMKRFQQTCLNNGFTKTIRASLEDCITGINAALYESSEVKLKVEEEDEFMKLVCPEESSSNIPEAVDVTLKIFNNEYAAVCKTILKECPKLDEVLVKLDVLLEKLIEELTKRYDTRAKRYVNICLQNEARVAFAKNQAFRCLREVGNVKQKVTATLMW